MLRGINLGGRRRVAMDDLRTLVRGLGADDVRTYVQSGNVVFRSRKASSTLVREVEESIRRSLGPDVAVVLRTKEELAEVVGGNPFLGSGIDAAKLHVTFLAEVPDADRVSELGEQRVGSDEFRAVGREIYLHCPNGYGRTKLSNARLERQLAVAATTRNWKTVTALADLASA